MLFDTHLSKSEINTQFLSTEGAEGLLVVMFVNCNSGLLMMLMMVLMMMMMVPAQASHRRSCVCTGTQVSYKLSMDFENYDDNKQP